MQLGILERGSRNKRGQGLEEEASGAAFGVRPHWLEVWLEGCRRKLPEGWHSARLTAHDGGVDVPDAMKQQLE